MTNCYLGTRAVRVPAALTRACLGAGARLDGIDLRDFGLQDLRRAATVLFQQPVHYNQTAAENISLGDIRRETDRPELESAAMVAGELLDSL